MQLLEETTSLCPSCLRVVPAQIYTDGVKVFMQKNCSEHGVFHSLIWSDLQLYRRSFRFKRPGTQPAQHATAVSNGCPYDCGLCPEHKQHTCLAILEVTSKCDLYCPICLASASKTNRDLEIEQIEDVLRKLFRYEGRATRLQISGGEPTVRRDLVDIVQIARNIGFQFIEIDTNGIRLAKKWKLARELADAGLTGVYLQFDGLTPEVYKSLRGSDLLSVKAKAIERAQEAGLEVALSATIVKGLNDHQLWEIIMYGIEKGVKGVNFQPFAMLGRYPQNLLKPLNRVTVPDVVKGIAAQSGGQLEVKDFIPIPCPDNRCAVLTYTIVKNKRVIPITRLVDVESLLDYYARVADFDETLEAVRKKLYDMWSFQANPWRARATSMDLLDGQYFSIACHGFQDIWNIDLNRIKNCCVHELTSEGRLVPACLYNSTAWQGETLYRGKHLNSNQNKSAS